MPLDPQTLGNLIMGAAALGAAFLAALWLSLIIWTYRDCRSRARDPLLCLLAAIIVALLFLPGVVIYLILRPHHTLEEEYQHTLEEEALLQAIEDNPVCPGCGRNVNDTWIVCPSCHTKLKKLCHQCHNLLELSWNLCPYCGTHAPGKRRDNQTLDELIRSIPLMEEAVTEEAGPLKPVETPEEPLNSNGAP